MGGGSYPAKSGGKYRIRKTEGRGVGGFQLLDLLLAWFFKGAGFLFQRLSKNQRL